MTIKAYQDVTIHNQSSGGGAMGGLGLIGLALLGLWRRHRRISALLPALLLGSAQASDWQLQLDYGHTHAYKDAADMTLSQGQLLGYDNRDSGYNVSLGYQVAPALALQLGYQDFGDASADIQGSTLTPAQYHALVKAVSPALGHAISVGVNYDWVHSNNWVFGVGAGLAKWSTDIDSQMGSSLLHTELTGTDLYFSAGLHYQVTANLELGLVWRQQRFVSNNASLTGVSLRWNF